MNYFCNEPEMSDPKYKGLSSLQYATAGAISGFVTRFTCQPLDVLKILFQLQVDPKGSSKYSSMLQSITVIVKEEGVAALWKGHVPAQCLSVAYGAIQFATYEKLLKLGSQLEKKSFSVNALHFYAGGVSGLVAISFSFPFDTIRTRLVAQQKSKLYKGMFDAGRHIWMNEGPMGFFRGYVPSCIQIGPAAGLVFGFKNIYTQLWNHFVVGLPTSNQVTGLGHMITGMGAGLTSKLVIFPLDVIKKRLQIQGMDKSVMCLKPVSHYGGIIHCLVLILKGEGFFGLYKGITPALIKSGAANSINFTVYNQICYLFDYFSR